MVYRKEKNALFFFNWNENEEKGFSTTEIVASEMLAFRSSEKNPGCLSEASFFLTFLRDVLSELLRSCEAGPSSFSYTQWVFSPSFGP